jgi:hypothetical protein
MSQTISTDEANEILWSDSKRQFVDQHRWYNTFLVVYEDDMKNLMGFYYDEPATEEQEGMDVFHGDPVPVFPVVAKELTTVVYERAE